jgi:hypothetical protein
MADEDQIHERTRDALAPFLAAALRARGPAELSAGSPDDIFSIDVRVGDIRRALVIYENDLAGDRLVDWIAEGRAARTRENRDHGGATAFVLEVAPPNGGAPTSFECADLDQVRDRVDEAAAESVEAMREFLGADASPAELQAQLGRQAFRRLTSQVSSNPGEAARFDLPDRPWLRLSVSDKPPGAR